MSSRIVGWMRPSAKGPLAPSHGPCRDLERSRRDPPSGGEKQRIAIDRLLLKALDIVVLDEATVHLERRAPRRRGALRRALPDRDRQPGDRRSGCRCDPARGRRLRRSDGGSPASVAIPRLP
jgi:hypothetical protein